MANIKQKLGSAKLNLQAKGGKELSLNWLTNVNANVAAELKSQGIS